MPDSLAVTVPHLDPLPLAAPAGLLWFLLVLTFFLHLLPMNFVLGGSVIALVARVRGADPARPYPRMLAQSLAKAMPVAIAATVTFGVAPLLFVQALYGRLFFTSSVLLAGFWFAVVPLVLGAYAGSYWLSFRAGHGGRGTALVAAVVTLCFVGVSFIYTNNMSLMLRPEVFRSMYERSGAGLQLNANDATLVPRYLHMLFSAIAVAGMAVAHDGAARMRHDPGYGRWVVRHGAAWFVIPTGLSMAVGLWWLGTLPRPVLQRFVGGSPFAAAVLGMGILLGLLTLVFMAGALVAPAPAKPLRFAGATLLLTLVAMILARDQVRRGALERAGVQPNPWVEPQWGPIVLFALCLVMALGLVVWMVTTLVRSQGGSDGAAARGDAPAPRGRGSDSMR